MIIHNPILTGSFTVNGTDVASITSSAASLTSLNAYTASQNILNGTYATTGSNTFAGIQTVNSNLVVTGSITAQTLVVQTITSSVDFVTGSTRFGSLLDNTHVFSGSVTMNPGGLFVSGSGRVGIGTTSPTLALSVIGQIRAGYDTGAGLTIGLSPIGVPNNDLNAYVVWGDAASFGGNNGDLIYIPRSSTSADHRFYTANAGLATEKMRITYEGKVGIGTISPRSTFDVRFNADRGIRFSSPGVSTEAVITSYQGDVTNNLRTLRLAGDIIYFNTGDGSNPSGSVRMTVDSTGNVGIGTISPTNKLTISNNGDAVVAFRINDTNANASFLSFNASNTDSAIIAGGTSAIPFDIYTSGSIRMRITSGGNVSIGGLTAPGRLLTLYKTSTPILQFVDAATGTSSSNGFLIYNGGLNAYLENTSNGFMQFQTNSQVKLNLGASANSDVYISSYTGYQHLFSGGDQYNTLLNGSGAIMYLNYQGNGAIKAGAGAVATLYAGSDIRIKKEISTVDSILNKVLSLIPKTFKYKDNKDTNLYYGFIAQEMEEVFPELVRTSEGISMCNDEEIVNQKSIESYGLVWASILTKAIQELQAQINELKNN
jgi:hypothetical protein